jgi:hypothetical protein
MSLLHKTESFVLLGSVRRLLVAAMFPVHRFLSPWWWRRLVSPKCRFLQEPHGVTSQKTPFFIRTWFLFVTGFICFTSRHNISQQAFHSFPCLEHSQGTLNLHPSGAGLPYNFPASVVDAPSLGFSWLLFDLLVSGTLLELELSLNWNS